jgi:hypothetical protein
VAQDEAAASVGVVLELVVAADYDHEEARCHDLGVQLAGLRAAQRRIGPLLRLDARGLELVRPDAEVRGGGLPGGIHRRG